MLKTRIIPTLLLKDMGLVKGKSFDSWRRVGTAIPAVRVYNKRQVDELVVMDVSATKESRAPDIEEIRHLAVDCFIPLTVGGGISSISHIKELLRAGADKVLLNSVCYKNQELIQEAAQQFGTQCVIVGIDVRKDEEGTYSCYSHSGSTSEDVCPVIWAQRMEKCGAGEILLTSIDNDGCMNGYDFEIIKKVSDAVNVPVIASGGAGSYEDMKSAVLDYGAQAVCAASIFHFTEQTPLGAKEYMAKHGIPVRIT